MKPIIIFKEVDKEGQVKLTKEELEKLLEDAYLAGYTEGRNASIVINPTPINPWPPSPTTPWLPTITWSSIASCNNTSGTACASSAN